MNDYSNSIKNRESKDDKKVEKVVKGKAVVKKKSEMSKIASNIIAEEAKSIKDYAIYDVIIPALKDGISLAFFIKTPNLVSQSLLNVTVIDLAFSRSV